MESWEKGIFIMIKLECLEMKVDFNFVFDFSVQIHFFYLLTDEYFINQMYFS